MLRGRSETVCSKLYYSAADNSSRKERRQQAIQQLLEDGSVDVDT